MQVTKLTVLGLIAALLWGGSAVMAQDTTEALPDGPARHQRRARMGGRQGPGRQPGGRIMQILTDEQKAQARDILETAREQGANAESRQQRREIMAKANEQVRALLTDEQKTQLQQGRRGRGLQLELTDEQKQQAAEIWSNACKASKEATNRVERVEIYKQAQTDLQALLTDEQKTKLEEFGKDRDPGINLTDQQKAEIAEIRRASRAAMIFAQGPQQRRELLKQSREAVKAVLTSEQIAKLEAFQKEHPKRADRNRRGGRQSQRGGRGGKAGPARMGRGGPGGPGMKAGPGQRGMGRGGWLDRQLDEPKDDLLADPE